MVKYGKEFRKNQIEDWKTKYFDYKAQKQLIKEYKRKKEDIPQSREIITLREELSKWSKEFEEILDKEIKRVYIFFANKEKELYKRINECLYLKEQYDNFELADFLNQYKELKDLSELSLNLSNFIYFNLKALIKILKKFDKKVITSQQKDLFLRVDYVQRKIEEQNSDILYLLKFKMIDEVNVILEDLINNLMKEFKSNKKRLGVEQENNDNDNIIEINDEINNINANNLLEEVPGIKEATSIIKQNHESIKKNIQKIDQISTNITKLFLPWKNFLRISSDFGSKFIQIQRENSQSDGSMSSSKSQSIIQSISFSRENKYNLFIVLFHGFLYMFSFSVIIPTYTSIIDYFEKTLGNNEIIGKASIYWGILMMMSPLGTLINYLYETKYFRRSTKNPIIISCLGLILGNFLYVIAPSSNLIILLFAGRFICGVSNLRTHNKMYIINFLLEKDVSFYLTMFHSCSILGLALGFIINSGLLFISSNNSFFNKNTMGPIITIILSIFLMAFTFIKFTEAHSKHFSITSMQMFGEGIISDDENYKPINSNEGEDVARKVRSQTLILKNIDDKLGDFNKENNFDDTNLVSKSINELTHKEEGGLHSLLNVFIVYLVIICTTKFINESIFINSHIFMEEIIGNNNEDDVSWRLPTILGCACFMILLLELALSCKNLFITERKLIMILLILLLINNALFLIFHLLKINHYLIIATDTVLASVTEKYVAHLFLYIIPESYILCRIHGNVLINIFSMISRILCSGLLIILNVVEIYDFNSLIFIVMTVLGFISLLLYLISYKDIRVKAINRIIKSIPKDSIKIATEV